MLNAYDLSERRLEMAHRLREARIRAGLTQAEAAGILNCSRMHMHRVEQGIRDLTGLELECLARSYRVPVTYFYRRLSEFSEDIEPSEQASRNSA